VTAVRALLEEGVDRGWFAGAAAVVSGEEGIREELYVGDARVEPEGESAPVGPETLWDLASTTKPLAGAALVLALTERRQLALEDTIGRFGDAYKKTRFDGVTLERLLTHSAGLAAWYPCYVKGEGRAAYRRALTEVDPAGPPGRAVLYSCLGYLLLVEGREADRCLADVGDEVVRAESVEGNSLDRHALAGAPHEGERAEYRRPLSKPGRTLGQ